MISQESVGSYSATKLMITAVCTAYLVLAVSYFIKKTSTPANIQPDTIAGSVAQAKKKEPSVEDRVWSFIQSHPITTEVNGCKQLVIDEDAIAYDVDELADGQYRLIACPTGTITINTPSTIYHRNVCKSKANIGKNQDISKLVGAMDMRSNYTRGHVFPKCRR